jgi:hypothetical protein
MPLDTIKRAIEKATGGGEGEQFEEITYEGYGPGGVAIIVETATDNKNRTAADVRSILTKAGGQLAGSGSVAWQFEQRGVITLAAGGDAGRAVTARHRCRRGRRRFVGEQVEVYTKPTIWRRSARARGGRRQDRVGRAFDDSQEHGRAGRGQGPPGAAAGRAARRPGRRPARDRQLRDPRRAAGRGRPRSAAEDRDHLGIDPGTAMLGYGVVERTGPRLRAIDYGVIKTSSTLPLPERLEAIYLALTD